MTKTTELLEKEIYKLEKQGKTPDEIAKRLREVADLMKETGKPVDVVLRMRKKR